MVDTNFIYGPIDGIRTLMANSAAFRTAVSAATVNDAKGVIYWFEGMDDEYDASNTAAARPRVILSYEWNNTKKTGVRNWLSDYAVNADFEFPLTDNSHQTSSKALMSTVNTVVSEMLAVEGVNDGTTAHPEITRVENAPGVIVVDPDDTEGGERFLWFGVRFIKEIE